MTADRTLTLSVTDESLSSDVQLSFTEDVPSNPQCVCHRDDILHAIAYTNNNYLQAAALYTTRYERLKKLINSKLSLLERNKTEQ